MEGKMTLMAVVVAASVVTLSDVAGYVPHLAPFFFLCNYHGNVQDLGLDSGEVTISISIKGEPTYYVPGQFYEVFLSSSINFDGLLLTGLYTMSTEAQALLMPRLPQAPGIVGQNLMCSVVHSHLSPHPQHQLSFIWRAPPEGTGCVKFLATATLGQQLLFKDTTVLQMCEEGSMTAPVRPELAEIHSDAVIFRDDFESADSLRQNLWMTWQGVEVTDKCGPVVYGRHALVCQTSGSRELVTVPLNTTSAKILQFSLALGSCGFRSVQDGDIVLAFGLSGCTQWVDMERISLSAVPKTEIHLIHLPSRAQGEGTCFRWSQLPSSYNIIDQFETTTSSEITSPGPTSSNLSLSVSSELASTTYPQTSLFSPLTTVVTKSVESDTTDSITENITTEESTTEDPKFGEVPVYDEPFLDRKKTKGRFSGSFSQSKDGGLDVTFEGCWALDNVVIVNMAHIPTSLEERFDPIDPGQWLFFPGAHVQHQCQSEGNAFVFGDRNQSMTFGTTRDLNLENLSAFSDALVFEQFESSVPKRWKLTGGDTGSQCGVVSSGSALTMDGEVKRRQVCTPLLEARSVGAVRFMFGMGVGPCSSTGLNRAAVVVLVVDEAEHSTVITTLLPQRYTTPQLVSLPVRYEGNVDKVRLCWLQKWHHGLSQDVWVLDDVIVLPIMPSPMSVEANLVLQASVNLQCHPSTAEVASVKVEYSSDHGHTWHAVYTPCVPGVCPHTPQPLSSVWSSDFIHGWQRITLPLPHYTLTPHVRFRFLQTNGSTAEWALDDVYIGSCPEKCNGHGRCTKEGCSCDFDYQGPTCGDPVLPLPSSFTENFEDPALLGGSALLHVHGGSLSYICDVLASGKALVFNRDGLRQLTTTEFNTTEASYLQFSIRVGSHSARSDCPPSSDGKDVVILEYSCDGGITWHFMKDFSQDYYKDPRSDSVVLPDSAKGHFCQFRWRQVGGSSGGLRAVWAVDDVVLSPQLTNTLMMDMAVQSDMSDRITANNGQLLHNFCGAPRSIVFSGKEQNEQLRYLMTEALQVSPGYMVQFDLVMGCGVPYTTNMNNQVWLQYSVDHGIRWVMVREPCLPPEVCQQYQGGTVYDASQFPQWKTVTVLLPPDTWSAHTRFRWVQHEWGSRDDWAIRRVYVGHQCPNMCSGHGHCNEGICKCEPGFVGDRCEPGQKMETDLHADFGIRYDPQSHFLSLLGGEVVHAGEGCGIILSGESIYFYKDGVRELQTKDLNLHDDDYLQFYLRIAGGQDEACRGAQRRNESVLLQYSTDGGISWYLLQELHHLEFQQPRFVHLDLPAEAKTEATRFRWWQPTHSGHGHDQWAVDEVQIGRYERLRMLQDDFDSVTEPLESGQWNTVTEGVVGLYCQSHSPSLIIGNQASDKAVITKDLQLVPGDIIQFRINVGCGKQFRWDHPVSLQFSHDGGQTWALVEEPCYQLQDCERHHTEGAIYYTGTHGVWTLVVIPVTQRIAMHAVILRWWQPGGMAHSFSLDDVYVGPPCPHNCHRHGVCKNGHCHCDDRTENNSAHDPHCQPQSDQPNPLGMLDRFDNRNMPTDYWRRVLGGYLGTSCGIIDFGNTLYFDGIGTREAVTVPLDSTKRRMLEFVVQVGSVDHTSSCPLPDHRNEGIIVDFSTDNEVTWTLLKVVEPNLGGETTQTVTLQLPPAAKTNATIFRWWQPLGLGGMQRAGWAIDSVLVGVNDTSAFGFQDDFSGVTPNPFTWFLADTAVPRITCNSKGHALEFSTNGGMRYAETWDYHITPSTFLQFDIAMGCGSLHGTLFSVMLEYSVNMGKTWHPVVSECRPPSFHCSGYHFSSSYLSDRHANWTRITVYLPPGAISPTTRFRWLQQSSHPRGTVWALDNVYLGDGCPWLCSGHGYCHNHTCVCDPGFVEPFCVPSVPLPMELHDTFSSDQPDRSKWTEIYGADASDMCGHLVSGNALVFHKDHVRLAVTTDIDTTMLTTVEFYFKYGCEHKDILLSDHPDTSPPGKGRPQKQKVLSWPRHHSVLLQYSTNGGITWTLLKEIHYPDTPGVRFFSVDLPMMALTNATRFRFWQPKNGGEMKAAWAIDNLFIGAMSMNPATFMDDFEVDMVPSPWLFINNGRVDEYCTFKTREDTMTAGGTALVFRRGAAGEVSVTTRDLDIGPMSVLQFDINVGCGTEPTNKYPVRLEYTSDGGNTWSLVTPNCAVHSLPRCFESPLPPTLYYGGTTAFWRRMIVPLDSMPVCGSVRFRWSQGMIPVDDFAPEWAIDNVYVGMACPGHCHGHGTCLGGMACACDAGYQGPTCIPAIPLPTYLKEDFFQSDVILPRRGDVLPSGFLDSSGKLNEEVWWVWGGGQRSTRCGQVFTGTSLVQRQPGERELTTRPLDLTRSSTVQFFAKLGCDPSVGMTPPVYLQYSIDGGVHWTSIEQFDFNDDSNAASYLSIHLPPRARTNATQVRWWQPSPNGVFAEDWAIDQIYIGGDIYGEEVLQDDPMAPRDSTWLMFPGGVIETVCDSSTEALHFNDVEVLRHAVSADVSVTTNTILQFDLAMRCKALDDSCYEVHLEFSLDMGQTWNLLEPACLPSNLQCSHYYTQSTYLSDLHAGWNRITLFLPERARSKSTRFRWRQPLGFEQKQSWALAHLFIGSHCPGLCGGHGRCHASSCVCDEGWGADDCSVALSPLPSLLTEDFNHAYDLDNWLKVVGGKVTKPCRVLSAGQALHFTGRCSRVLIMRDLNLTDSMLVQFYFMFGCISPPVRRDQGVLVDYSTDGGITWEPLAELYYNLYNTPTFISVKLPPGAKKQSTRFRWWQPQHGGHHLGDWVIDGIRVNGEEVNPNRLTLNFTSSGFDYRDLVSADNMKVADYCGQREVAVGTTEVGEASQLVSREVYIADGYQLQFVLNVGCGQAQNRTLPPVRLQYSTDHGVTWSYFYPPCHDANGHCAQYPSMPVVLYGHAWPVWERVVVPLYGLPTSNGTRFRWRQEPEELPQGDDSGVWQWALQDVYVGEACKNLCNGHGFCRHPVCVCDRGYTGSDCGQTDTSPRPMYLRDTFFSPPVNVSQWGVVQGGGVGEACEVLVEGNALVFSAPGLRQAVTIDLDLQSARFVQYTAVIGGLSGIGQCTKPQSRFHNVYLQYSTDGGIVWHTLHVLDHTRYLPARTDYLPLPQEARTHSTRLRWWQPPYPALSIPGTIAPQWAIDDVLIGGWEINPSFFHQSFDLDTPQQDDSSVLEFHPYGSLVDDVCARKESALAWEEDGGEGEEGGQRSFTTSQLIVQPGYMLQFKLVVGCSQHYNVCQPLAPVVLEFNRNPLVDRWQLVQPLCLPDSSDKRSECRPHLHHDASIYTVAHHPTWTRLTIHLHEKAHSSSTRFRWRQERKPGLILPSWAIDDIYVGEKCPEMCSGRGDCNAGVCNCDKGYYGPTCLPQRSRLLKRMFESFEGGIFSAHWSSVSGGNIGFGCGALRPYAHGKTLYFNGCGIRQAVTTEMDTSHALKVIFVLQIGCQAQTKDCNVLLGEGDDYRGILLQYTHNQGADWHLLARHDPKDFLTPQRVAYDLPSEAKRVGLQFRWWQPVHDGIGHDQWAIDHIEIISGYRQYSGQRTQA